MFLTLNLIYKLNPLNLMLFKCVFLWLICVSGGTLLAPKEGLNMGRNIVGAQLKALKNVIKFTVNFYAWRDFSVFIICKKLQVKICVNICASFSSAL